MIRFGSSKVILCMAIFLVKSRQSYTLSEEAFTNSSIASNEKQHRTKRTIPNEYGPHSTYKGANGLTCFVCRPGFDCQTNVTTAGCEPCPSGEYNGMFSAATRCAKCSSICIDHNAVIFSHCNSTTNMICRCENGFYYSGGEEGKCLHHTECLPGYEVQFPGTHETNTICRPCPKGTYSLLSSMTERCIPCTKCTQEQLVDRECDSKTNTDCKEKVKGLVVKIVIPLVVFVVLVVGIVIIIIYLRRRGYLTTCQRLCISSMEANVANIVMATENTILQGYMTYP